MIIITIKTKQNKAKNKQTKENNPSSSVLNYRFIILLS